MACQKYKTTCSQFNIERGTIIIEPLDQRKFLLRQGGVFKNRLVITEVSTFFAFSYKLIPSQASVQQVPNIDFLCV